MDLNIRELERIIRSGRFDSNQLLAFYAAFKRIGQEYPCLCATFHEQYLVCAVPSCERVGFDCDRS